MVLKSGNSQLKGLPKQSVKIKTTSHKKESDFRLKPKLFMYVISHEIYLSYLKLISNRDSSKDSQENDPEIKKHELQ